MKILLINWQKGENNPFDYFNSKLIEQFRLYGCIVSVIDLDESFVNKVKQTTKVDLAIAWQGIGSNVNLEDGSNLWEKMKIPLVCLHGDHPCHMPMNHSVDNPYVHHIYGAPSFARYSNTYFNKSRPSIYYLGPNIFNPIRTSHRRQGNFFVFPKNLDPINETLKTWRESLKPETLSFLIEASEEIISDYDSNTYKDHHQRIDSLITRERFDKIKIENNVTNEVSLFHKLHALLDKIYRNHASEQVVKLLADYPLRVYGRGWDSFAGLNVKHEFLKFDLLSDGDFQFYSNYGIIDIASSVDSLHDRMFRACANNGAFISNSLLSNASLLDRKFDDLFYRMNNNSLLKTVERIISAPKVHLDMCEDFSNSYDNRSSFYAFYLYLINFSQLRF